MIRGNGINNNYMFILKSLDDECFKKDFIDYIKKLFWDPFDDSNSINDDLVLMWNGHEVDLIPTYNYEHFKIKQYSKDDFEATKKNHMERGLPNIPKNVSNHELIKYWKKTKDFEQEVETSLRSNLKRDPHRIEAGYLVAYCQINDDRDGRLRTDSEYKNHYLAIWEGKRMLAVVCEKRKVEKVYSQIFIPHMTIKELENWQKIQRETYESFDEYTEEDSFRDGFDGDIDAWNQYNQ